VNRVPVWFWAVAGVDMLLLVIGLYMAVSAVEIAVSTSGGFVPVAIAVVFAALPVFCIAAPIAARRAQRRKRSRVQVVVVVAAPWVYALLLVVFLFNS
jgi:hypothetical protein